MNYIYILEFKHVKNQSNFNNSCFVKERFLMHPSIPLLGYKNLKYRHLLLDAIVYLFRH